MVPFTMRVTPQRIPVATACSRPAAQQRQCFRTEASRSNTALSTTPEVFRRLEEVMVHNLNDKHTPGGSHWIAGAAPELAYKLMLESLAARNVTVVAVPYATNFDNQRLADEIQTKSLECLRVLSDEFASLPVYAMGHGIGSLLQLLVMSKHRSQCDGAIMLSYYNRPAADVIPFLSPMVAPGLKGMGGAFSQLAASPVRSAFDMGTEQARHMSPTVVKMVMPLFEQVNPVVMDVARGNSEWYPTPKEAAHMISSYYGVSNNLLIQFQDDDIDQTPKLVDLLKEADFPHRVRLVTLAGGHNRPAQQNFLDMPGPIASAIRSSIEGSSTVLGGLSNIAADIGLTEVKVGLTSAGKQVGSMSDIVGGVAGGPMTDSARELADEIAAWMGVGGAYVSGGRAGALKEYQSVSIHRI